MFPLSFLEFDLIPVLKFQWIWPNFTAALWSWNGSLLKLEKYANFTIKVKCCMVVGYTHMITCIANTVIPLLVHCCIEWRGKWTCFNFKLWSKLEYFWSWFEMSQLSILFWTWRSKDWLWITFFLKFTVAEYFSLLTQSLYVKKFVSNARWLIICIHFVCLLICILLQYVFCFKLYNLNANIVMQSTKI